MFALSADSISPYTLRYAFKLAKDIGFDGLEILANRRRCAYQADYLNRLQSEYRLPILSIHSPYNGYIAAWEIDEVERVKHSVALAKIVNAQAVIIHPPLRFVRFGTSEMLADILLHLPFGGQKRYHQWLKRELKSFQSKTPITIAVENLPYICFLGFRFNPYQIGNLAQLKRFDHLAFDVTHLGKCGIDILKSYEYLKGRIAHVHLSNYNGREHSLLTDGQLPLKQLLRRLKQDDYKGIITIEISSRALGVGNKKMVYNNLIESLSFCHKFFV
jgi:sugar phosphate isomerase/epimerase